MPVDIRPESERQLTIEMLEDGFGPRLLKVTTPKGEGIDNISEMRIELTPEEGNLRLAKDT